MRARAVCLTCGLDSRASEIPITREMADALAAMHHGTTGHDARVVEMEEETDVDIPAA